MESSHLEIVSLERWNRSPRCRTDSPVTDAYRKIASFSSNETYLDRLIPASWSAHTRWWNTCWWIPSSVCIHLGWPCKSSSTQPSPVRIEVWYGVLSNSGLENAIAPLTRVWTKTPAAIMMARKHWFCIWDWHGKKDIHCHSIMSQYTIWTKNLDLNLSFL